MGWINALSRKSILIPVILIALLGGIGLWWFWSYQRSPEPGLIVATTHKGDLVATVTATGTIEPEEVVDVGAQIVGIINNFGTDPSDPSKPIDFGSVVENGTILARIDDSLYRARLDKASALVEQAKAQVLLAQADLGKAEANAKEAQAKATQATRDFTRAQKLHATGALAEQDFDVAQSAYEVTKAEIAVTQAVVRQGQATLNSSMKTQMGAEADKREAQKNLDYTVIRSPVKGVIIDRRVNVGQTVVSSLNAPSLFLIAKDLTKLQVWASVNEADVGRIKKGQPVRFSVDAFPGEEFLGVVSQVRLNATMTQNVVTYTVVVTTDNSSGKLLPYLTATLKFEVGRSTQALLVSNAALRWEPKSSSHRDRPQADQGIVWILENGKVEPVEVRTGLSDGLTTEILSGELKEGQKVVVGEKQQSENDSRSSPFAPNIMGGRPK